MKAARSHWKLGNEYTRRSLERIWDKQNDSVYDGQSYFIKAKDTIHSEKFN
jgi:hypothetical protein